MSLINNTEKTPIKIIENGDLDCTLDISEIKIESISNESFSVLCDNTTRGSGKILLL